MLDGNVKMLICLSKSIIVDISFLDPFCKHFFREKLSEVKKI